MTADPYQFWTAQQIATASGCPPESVPLNWPGIVAALEARGIADRATQVAAIGTIAIETASTFAPVREAFWLDEAWRQANLRYYPFYGRGYIQLTWADGYASAGSALGIDLTDNPDLALEPTIAAQVLAWYFATHGGPNLIPEAARRSDWTEVRRLVQGGSAGLDRLITIATALGETVAPDPAPTYDPTTPVVPQNHDWDCAEQSTLWAMTSYGRHPADSWMEASMLTSGIESTDLGLLVADGSKLAAWITEQYGEFKYHAFNLAQASFNDVQAVSGLTPVLIGGRQWNHWSGVRRYNQSNDWLELANPADGWMDIHQTMTRAQFEALGPFSMVVVQWGDAQPAPPPPSDQTAAIAALQAQVAALTAERDGLIVTVADISDRLGDQLAGYAAAISSTVDQMRAERGQAIGPRP